MEHVTHAFSPFYTPSSRVLILGTMPSPKSRENGFYYSHPQNRFWRVVAHVLADAVPQSTEQKQAFLVRHHIALWDVLASCYISGADDASIRSPQPNNIAALLQNTGIATVFTTGSKAAALYKRLCQPQTGIAAIQLPSTSPANCRCRFEQLAEAYGILAAYLQK